MSDREHRIIQWLITGEPGLSSRAIVAVMEDVDVGVYLSHYQRRVSPNKRLPVPHDPDDFIRCMNLLEVVPEYRDRMDEMREASEAWENLVQRWSEIERAIHEDCEIPRDLHFRESLNWNQRMPEAYRIIQQCIEPIYA